MSATVADMVDNILGYWHDATPEQREAGAGWYPVARELAAQIGTLAGFDASSCEQQGAGIIAALSPRIQWTYNIVAAREVAIRPYLRPSGIFTTSWDKARRIAEGARPSEVLGGRKVRSFYRNILGDDSVVCIDGHAYSLAAPGHPTKRLERKGEYARVEAAYILAAQFENVSPPTMQATTWLVRQAEQRSEAAAQRVRVRYGRGS